MVKINHAVGAKKRHKIPKSTRAWQSNLREKRQVFLKRHSPICLRPYNACQLSSGCHLLPPHSVCLGFTFGVLNCFRFFRLPGEINHALCPLETTEKGLKSKFRSLRKSKWKMPQWTSKRIISVCVCTNTLGENLSNICSRDDIYTEILASHPRSISVQWAGLA